jgi:hypothetical protein
VGQQATLSLADSARALGDRGLAIDLRRSDIETALRSADDGLELLLDLEAREADGGATRRHTLAVGCTPADLERMLLQSGDSIRVSFDAEALAQAIAPDIEAHGLREKMVVLAVVVATTGAAAGGAQAMPTLGGQSGGSGGTTVTSTRDMPADSLSASVASSEGAPATRANPGQAAAAVAAASEAPSTQQGPYSGGAPFQEPQATTQPGLDPNHPVLPSGHHMAPTVMTDTARDLPSDSLRTSPPPAVAHGAAGATISSSEAVDTSTLVIVGGTTLALLGAAFGAAAAGAGRTPKPT